MLRMLDLNMGDVAGIPHHRNKAPLSLTSGSMFVKDSTQHSPVHDFIEKG
jgi:hypothetical protein